MLRSIGKQSGESMESVVKKRKATLGRICRQGGTNYRIDLSACHHIVYNDNNNDRLTAFDHIV